MSSASSSSPSAGATEWEVYYTLHETQDSKELENSSSIVFDALCEVKTKAHKIKGFTITVTAENEDEIMEKANTQAERLAQIMTLKSLGYVEYAYHGHNPKNPQVSKPVRASVTCRYHIRGTIDELNLNSNQRISSVMQNDEDTNIQLYHAHLAMEAEENRQYANMYRELFQVIEKETGLPCYQKYKSLRHALSHQTKLDRAMPKVKKYFGEERYDFTTTTHEFNHNSKKNREHLKEDADNLKKIVIAYLIGKLR
jgi:hypothetical protein